MISLKKVLFPTDFSDCARAAQNYALAFAEQFGAELHVIYVVPETIIMMPDGGTPTALPTHLQNGIYDEAVRALEQEFPDDSNGKCRVVRAVQTGNPYYEIVTYAEKQGVDLIVIGTHGRNALLHLLMGSVAEKVVRKAKCPVLSVHPNEPIG